MKKVIIKKWLKDKAYKEIKELDRNEIHLAVNEFFDTLREVFLSGNGVRFMSFGSFFVKRRYIGVKHDFKTKKMVNLGSRNVVTFIPSKKLNQLAKRK